MAKPTFEQLCEELLDQGIYPTATEFARRGWPYVNPACNRRYHIDGRPPCPVPGSGTTWTSGRITAKRRDFLLAHGYMQVNVPYDYQSFVDPPDAEPRTGYRTVYLKVKS